MPVCPNCQTRLISGKANDIMNAAAGTENKCFYDEDVIFVWLCKGCDYKNIDEDFIINHVNNSQELHHRQNKLMFVESILESLSIK